MSPAAESRSSKNCTSVSSSAASGMLLTSAILRHCGCVPRLSADRMEREEFFRDKSFGTRPPSITIDIPYLPNRTQWSPRTLVLRLVECLSQVGNDIVDVFDAHAQANHFRRHTRFQLFFRRQLTMRGGRGMAS